MVSAGPAGLVLAAGAGRRLGGRPKALLRHEGRFLVDRAIDLVRSGGCERVHVVLGSAAATVRERADLEDVFVVDNDGWSEGIGSSVRVGLASLSRDEDAPTAAVVVLADQPFVGPEAVRRVIAAHAGGATVAMARYEQTRGHPVLLARSCWDEAIALATGDLGARPFLRTHPELVVAVDCVGTGDPADIDLPADLALLRA